MTPLGVMMTPLAMLTPLLMMKVGNSLISSAEVEGQVGGQFQVQEMVCLRRLQLIQQQLPAQLGTWLPASGCELA